MSEVAMHYRQSLTATLAAFTLLALHACAEKPAPAPAVTVCDRACLIGMVDQYLAALGAHDPAKAPFSADARFTENAQLLKLGDALWRTADANSVGYKLVVAEAAASQSGFYVAMKENGNPIWLSGRLKVSKGRITELETVVLRKGANFGNYDLTQPLSLWNEAVPVAQRRGRDELIQIADSYFEALEKNLKDTVPFHDDCNRVENGLQTTNNSTGGFGGGGPDVGRLGCRDNINSMMWRYITLISPRRYLIVDEECGIVFGIFMFHHDGSQEKTSVPGFGEYRYPVQVRRPFTTVIPEMFKITDGKIRQIEAHMASLPYGSRPNWE
jgi:hypothetical protein